MVSNSSWWDFFLPRRSTRSRTSSSLEVEVKNGFLNDWKAEDENEEFQTVPLHKASTDQNNDYRLGIPGTRKEVDTIVYEGVQGVQSVPVSRCVWTNEERREEKAPRVSIESMSTVPSMSFANSEDELTSKDSADTSDKEEEEECKLASSPEAVVESTADGGEAAPPAQPIEHEDDSRPVAISPSTSESQDMIRFQSATSATSVTSSEALSPTGSFDDANEQVKKRWQCIQTIMVGDKYQKKLKSGQEIPPPPNPAGQYSKRKWELAMAEWRNSLA